MQDFNRYELCQDPKILQKRWPLIQPILIKHLRATKINDLEDLYALKEISKLADGTFIN